MDGEKKKAYTIEDVAKTLGVSKTTVSRAISGKGRISEATRQRVLECIRQYDYRPNVFAQALAQSKTYNIGLLLPGDYSEIDFPFFKDCMNGICSMASKHNYDVVVAMADSGDLTQLQRMAGNRKVDGVIVSRALVGSAVQGYLKEREMPYVVIGTPHEEEREVLWVDNQNREGSRELTGILLIKGQRRLALLGGSRAHLVTESRMQGFLEAHRQLQLPVREELLFFDMDSYAKISAAADRILKAGADGIIGMDDFITNMLLGCLRERKIAVPEQLCVASLYDSRILEYHTPPVTSLRFNTKGLGQNACLMLLKQLGVETGEERVPLNYQVILRESTQTMRGCAAFQGGQPIAQ